MEEQRVRVKHGRAGHGAVMIYRKSVAEKLLRKGIVSMAEDQDGANEPTALEDMTHFELLKAAREAGVRDVQKFSKRDDLIGAISRARGETGRPQGAVAQKPKDTKGPTFEAGKKEK